MRMEGPFPFPEALRVGRCLKKLRLAFTEEQVRKRTRPILAGCAPGGNFCLGWGNPAPNFCQIERTTSPCSMKLGNGTRNLLEEVEP